EKRIRKACARARQVFVYCYGGRTADLWWKQVHDNLGRFDNLTVVNLPETATAELAGLVQRTMQLQCTIQEGQVWMSSDVAVQIEPQVWSKP
ncbi:MAG TPA: YaeQ family protein, partial [Gammaproteobacteria bacterium]